MTQYNFFLNWNQHFGISNHTVSECCSIKLLPYVLSEKINYYFSIGNGQPREPALYANTQGEVTSQNLWSQWKIFIRVLPTRWRRKAAGIEITSLSLYVLIGALSFPVLQVRSGQLVQFTRRREHIDNNHFLACNFAKNYSPFVFWHECFTRSCGNTRKVRWDF